MSKTIEQIRDYYENEKPELRWLVGDLIEFLEANPGGGGGVQSITGDGIDNTDPQNPVITAQYKSYVAILSQSGVNVPEAVEILNEFQSATYIYNGVGTYRLRFPSQTLVENKTSISITNGNSGTPVSLIAYRLNDTDVVLQSIDNSPAFSDNLLLNATIEIKVFQ